MRHVRLGGRHGSGLSLSRSTTAKIGIALVVPALAAGLLVATGAKAPNASAATTPYLPFDKPALSTNSKLVFAHYLPSLPISLDNKTPTSDYYAVNYLSPTGEGGKHKAYGGFLRDRPKTRSVLSTSAWQLADMETEVRQAISAGIDGFAVDILNPSPSAQTYVNITLLLKAAANVSSSFKIMLQPDMSAMASRDLATIAAATAALGKYPAAFNNSNGHLIVSPFQAERRSVSWWTSFKSTMANTYGLPVDLFPVLNNDQTYAASFAPISIGIGNWGSRNPQWNPPNATTSTSPVGRIAKVHSLGKLWMQPVSVQDSRMKEGIYDEAANTQNLRDTWAIARNGKADWILLPTWNDYTENSEIAPSALHGYTFLDLMAYYITWFKTGSAPAIVRDGVYLTHRKQPYAAMPSYPQTIIQKLRGGTPARNTVESLNFLTAASTVTITVGGVSTSCSVPAGVSVCLAPLRAGSVSVVVTRGGSAVTGVTSTSIVDSTPYVQDLQYVGVSSLRSGGASDPAVTNPAPAPKPTPTPTPIPTSSTLPTVTTKATIVGTARVGTVATCSAAAKNGAVSYRWTVNGSTVARVTASRLRVPAAYVGKSLGCKLVAINTKGSVTSIAAAKKVGLGAAPVAIVRPSWVAFPKVGTSVSVRAGSWSARPAYFRYVYVVNGKIVALMAKPTIRISSAWRGKAMAVIVRAYAAGRLVGASQTAKVIVR